MEKFTLVCFHDKCSDGACSAAIAQLHSPEANVVGMSYGVDPPPLAFFKGERVLFVDFSFPRKIMEKINEEAESLLVIDHHKSAQEDLKDLSYAIFDMKRSGAGLTWDTLFPALPRPWVVNYVEDRDLWNFALPNSKEISLYLQTINDGPETFHRFLTEPVDIKSIVTDGEFMKFVQDIKHERALENFFEIGIEGYSMACINHPYDGISDLLNRALEAYPQADVAAGFFIRADLIVQFSFRSRKDSGVDVSELAKKFGGGGHMNAAGAEITIEEFMSMFQQLEASMHDGD